MAVKIFAAIVIGSAETEMRVYDLAPSRGMRELDRVSTRLSLGVEAYQQRRLDPEKVRDLCDVLKDYKAIMEGYQADAWRVCATSALRELKTSYITKDYIEKQTGLKIDIISNSEQRFLDYQSIASESDSFEKIIANGTAIVDIGGNSMQISVFDKDKLVTTQNIRMGKINTREHYFPAARNNQHYEQIIKELLNHELDGFFKLYQKERQILNLIVADADLMDLAVKHFPEISKKNGRVQSAFQISADQFKQMYEAVMEMNADQIAAHFSVSADSALLVMQSMIFCGVLMNRMEAQTLWLMDVSICDGLCYEYGVSGKLIRRAHNFEDDIIAASRNIAKRYKCNNAHIKCLEVLCTEIFNKTKKIHGMKSRDRLLLQIAAILHNCGKYISLVNVSDAAYNIIMATEIIGLSHSERKIIANVVRYNNKNFDYYQEVETSDLNREEYLKVAKMTAILRLANALDRSHTQKCKDAVVSVKDRELVITVRTPEDLTLEKVTVADRAAFFEEVFNLHPVLHQKK